MSASRLMWENEIRAPQFFAGLPQTKPRLRQLSPLPGGHALLRAPQNCLGAKKSEKIRFGFLSTWTVRGSLVVAVLPPALDRKSTRLNSSHGYISYAVFCLKKKKHYRNRRKLVFSTWRSQFMYGLQAHHTTSSPPRVDALTAISVPK